MEKFKASFDDMVRLTFEGCLNIAANDEIYHNKSNKFCRDCGNLLTVAYHEEKIYSVHCWRCRKVMLVSADNQEQAVEKSGLYKGE